MMTNREESRTPQSVLGGKRVGTRKAFERRGGQSLQEQL